MAERPNVVFILSDQQRWDTVGAYGCPVDLTPNLDALAKRGVRFERAFTCQPVCAPARGCLQTGKYATAHGVYRNGIPLAESERTLAHFFKDAGYDVGYTGKWHLAETRDQAVPPARGGGYVDHWVAADLLEFTSHPYDGCMFDADMRPVPVEGYRVDWTTEQAMRWLRARRSDNPFYLFLSYLEPHHQNDWNRFVAPDGYAERYANNAWVPGDLRGRPGDWPSQWPDYLGCIKSIDENVGRILAELPDNTLVFYTSDHGCHFRTRNAEYKRSCHESSIRIPAIVAGPGVARGRVVEEIVSLVDFPPTLLDVAGISVPGSMQGQSMARLWGDGAADWPEEAFFQISEAEVGRGIRTRQWKYSLYAPEKSPRDDAGSDTYVERYLYDLRADPHETYNLVGRPDHAEVAAQLRERLVRRMVAAGEAAPEITPARYPAG
ncbi:MAG TPA: sulfatase-like hydrolase/transferase [Chloroflexota bacterium]|jgi:arylsulfatase A-like enzyme|nr:sulfatase-like hydrolase/transferase [Chloroflexota bacterium]